MSKKNWDLILDKAEGYIVVTISGGKFSSHLYGDYMAIVDRLFQKGGSKSAKSTNTQISK